ncbi:MAG: hypothetical protein ABI813_09180 [Bacteroidota bacterium]
MKVDNLLGLYLYQHKKLSLPGIGLFTLDDKAVLPDDNAKVKIPIEGISFNAKTGAQLDDSLVQYIKEQTGKMKALAEADLYSFIATAFQFLNIGKPFYFEGIGTLQKNKDGAYSFVAGTMIPQRTEEIPSRYSDTARKNTYNNNNNTTQTGSGYISGKLLIALGILVTLLLIAWGGYYLYNKNTSQNTGNAPVAGAPALAPDTTSAVQTVPDSTGKNPAAAGRQPDSLSRPTAAAVLPGGYKFIFETTDKKMRALKRYEQLKGIMILKEYNNKVAIETKDSLSFKIYTRVPCTAADTARVKALLNAWYFGKKEMKIKIEP